MNEVSCRVYDFFEEATRRANLPMADLVAGLPVSLEHLQDPTRRIDWDVMIEMLERLERLVGTRADLETMGAYTALNPMTRPLRAVAGYLGDVRLIYRAAMSWFGPSLFQTVNWSYEDLPGGRGRVVVELPPPLRESPQFLHMLTGALRAGPRILGQPDAQVLAEITPRRGVYTITPPPPVSLLGRLRGLGRVVFRARSTLDELALQQRQLRESYEALIRSQRDFHTVSESLPDGMVIQRGGWILYVNPAFAGYLGAARPRDLLGRELATLVAPEDRERLRALVAAGPAGVATELRLLRPDLGPGAARTVEVAPVQPVQFEGSIAGLVVARDVTERKQAEAGLALADRMLSVGTLAAGVAHEINNPLTYVIANLRGLARRLRKMGAPGTESTPEELADLEQMVADACDGAERVRDIVGDLKTFSRGDDQAAGPIDVHAVLDASLKMAANEIRHRAQVVKDYAPRVPPVVATTARLGQVFLNLILNAAQAIPEGHADENTITVRTRHVADHIEVEVRDTGAGIPPAILGRIFDPFFTTRPATATGLGLAISHRIVAQLGGDLAVDSGGSGSGGTLLRVRLPAATTAAAGTRPADPSTAERNALPRARILIVDDEPRIAEALASALEGHDVSIALSGREALTVLCARDSGRYHVVFCDLLMPEVSGMDLHEQLQRLRPGLEQSIVFMTAGAFTNRAREFLARVPNTCLEKPFDMAHVLALVASAAIA